MKNKISKTVYCLVVAGLCMMFSSCYKDDSTVADSLIPGITIADFPDGGYSVVSYADNYLDIVPEVKTDYPEEELTYSWYLIDNAVVQSFQDEDYKAELIAQTKALHYKVNLFPGSYVVFVKVQASNGYSVTKKTALTVTTRFSTGFYILKETVDGDTDVDLAEPSNQFFLQDVLKELRGEALKGSPEAISTTISQGYINETTHQMDESNILTVTTQLGQISVMRTSDLKEVMNADNLLFTQFDEGEKPYKIVQCMWSNVLMTNKGIRTLYQASLDNKQSGKFGITNGISTDRYAAFEPNSSCLFLWDSTTRNVAMCDYNGTVRHGSKEDNGLGTMAVYTCQYIGYNYAADRIVYVLRHKNGQLWTMTIQGQFGSGWMMQELKPAKAFAPNWASSTQFALCVKEATVLYGVKGGELWAYDFVNNTEKQIQPAGIGTDETITYVSDQYPAPGYSMGKYLVIGTQKGKDYTLRFYQNFGGQPDGEPTCTVSGKGVVKAIRYTDSSDIAFYHQGTLAD